MSSLFVSATALAAVALVVLALSIRVLEQYERALLFRLGRMQAPGEPGLTVFVPGRRAISVRS